MAARIVAIRSAAETPVVTPEAASTDTVKLVPWRLVLCRTMGGRSRLRALSEVMHRQTIPLQWRINWAICAMEMLSAGKIRSPSFSRSSSSVSRIPDPRRRDSAAASTRRATSASVFAGCFIMAWMCNLR